MSVQNLAKAIKNANELHQTRDVAVVSLDRKIKIHAISKADTEVESQRIQKLNDQIKVAEYEVTGLGMDLLKVMLERNGHYDEAKLLTHYMKLS